MRHAEDAARGNLTQSQFLVWMGQKLNADAPLYNMIVTFDFEGELNAPAFRAAFQRVIDGTDVLRTIIEEREGVPYQIVLPAMQYEMSCIDFTHAPNPEQAARAWIDRQRLCLFDLSQQLFDSVLLKLSATRHIWYLSQHHLITDGWSVLVLYRRQAEVYAAITSGKADVIEAMQRAWPQFASYALHEKTLRNTPALEKASVFWDARSTSSQQLLEFFGKVNQQRTARTERVVCDLGRERTVALRAIAREKGFATLSADLSLYNIYTTLTAAFVRRETDACDVRIGVPFHNRLTPAFKNTAGMFIEIGPLQLHLQDEDTFVSLHRKAAGDMLLAMRHTMPGISTAQRNHAYEVFLNFVNVSFPMLGNMQPKVEWVHAGYGDRNHALRLQIHDFGNTGSDQLLFDFNIDVFDEQQRGWAVKHFLRFVDAFIEDRSRRINDISLQSAAEHEQLVRTFNQTDAPYPTDKTVVALFEEQVALQSNAVAVEHEGLSLTYAELSRRASQIAHHLHSKGAHPGSIVVIRMVHSIELVAAILGVLKAGCAYAPIDPAYPEERLMFMLDDIAAAGDSVFLITQPALCEANNMNAIVLDSTFASLNGEIDRPINLAMPEGLAYVIYTSGSTGQPKGVMISHRSLLNYIHWAGKQYTDGERLNWALFTSISFDLTVTTVFTPLVTGGRIIAYRDDENAPGSALLKIIHDNRCDVVKLTPSHLSMIHEMDLRHSRIRRFVVGGEDLKTSLAISITQAFGKRIDLCNEYGPTEATVGCMIHRFDMERDRELSVPIGTPAANAKIFVLDAHLNPVPAGVAGEMYIAGDGLAIGYFNRDELTHERFITVEDARLSEHGAPMRLYKTGDLARWDAQGWLEFLGRADQQVKIAGVRMELGEIEARLLSHPEVRECAVVLMKPALTQSQSTQHCARCGLESNYPGVSYDQAGVCNFCRAFEHYKDRAMAYFKTMGEFTAIAEKMKAARQGEHDCIVLLSGGKDSTYMLYQLVGMGLRPLAFTLDNGFISDEAKANIQRVVTALGVDHVFGQMPAMNAIFVDSLKRYANVCNGCFKTIYSLATQLARERSIGYIVTGLSRGQFFETRLSEDVFTAPDFDADAIDEAILAARKAYHRRDDVISRSLDVDLFREDVLFDDVQFVDFYRYCTVSLDELYGFIKEHAPWIRPSDTGRSTNCLINEAGIFVHKKLRGFHNYALPYSWDVRLGHKQRADALEELDDAIDASRVQRMLREIGFDDPRLKDAPAEKLVAYFTADARVPAGKLQSHLLKHLPANAVPASFVQLDRMPLTPNGKIDRKALPAPDAQHTEVSSSYVAPRNATEQLLAEIWAKALRVERVGIHDNFFELSGDSIISIQIIAKANQAGLKLAPNQIFMRPTIAELAEVATPTAIEAEPDVIAGEALLTPIQHWFFEQQAGNVNEWNHVVQLDVAGANIAAMRKAVNLVVSHHDAFRLRFEQMADGWKQRFSESPLDDVLTLIDVSALDSDSQQQAIDKTISDLNSALDIVNGQLVRAALILRGNATPARLVIVAHHLTVDGVSWWVLLKDMDAAYAQALRHASIQLPAKTTSFKRWAEQLKAYAGKSAHRAREFWQQRVECLSAQSVFDVDDVNRTQARANEFTTMLGAQATGALLQMSSQGLRINTVLLAALAQAMTDAAGESKQSIMVEGHGREALFDTDLSRTVGWFTSLYPICLGAQPNGNAGDVLHEAQNTLAALLNNGLDYGVLRYLSDETDAKAMTPSHAPAVLFNYLGQTDAMLNDAALFTLAKPLALWRHPHAVRPFALEVNAFITGDVLQVAWTHCGEERHSRLVRHVSERFMHHLGQLAVRKEGPYRNGALHDRRIANAGVTDAELDSILAEFAE